MYKPTIQAVAKAAQWKETEVYFYREGSQGQAGWSCSLPDSTNVALLAATKQIVHVHDPRTVFGPL